MIAMLAEERRARILERISSAGLVRIADLVDDLGVSVMTVRRDLDILAADGQVEKIHGGAALRSRPSNGESWTPVRRIADPQQTHVAIVVPRIDYYFSHMVSGARRVLDDANLRRSLTLSEYMSDQERTVVQDLIDAGTKAVLFAPTIDLGKPDEEYESWLCSLPVPVVLMERQMSNTTTQFPISSVSTAFDRGIWLAIEHLAAVGHRSIAFVTHGALLDLTELERNWQSCIHRFALTGSGSPLIIDPDFGRWQGTPEANNVLDQVRDSGATAIFCRSDRLALVLLHHMRLRGWSVPGDISMISYDDEIAELADPPLTAISPPKEWIGATAAQIICEMLATGTTEAMRSPARIIQVAPELVTRASTAAPRDYSLP